MLHIGLQFRGSTEGYLERIGGPQCSRSARNLDRGHRVHPRSRLPDRWIHERCAATAPDSERYAPGIRGADRVKTPAVRSPEMPLVLKLMGQRSEGLFAACIVGGGGVRSACRKLSGEIGSTTAEGSATEGNCDTRSGMKNSVLLSRPSRSGNTASVVIAATATPDVPMSDQVGRQAGSNAVWSRCRSRRERPWPLDRGCSGRASVVAMNRVGNHVAKGQILRR